MGAFDALAERWAGIDAPCLVGDGEAIRFAEIRAAAADLSAVRAGDVVALIGDFDPVSIASFLQLVDRAAIVVPLTAETRASHDAFFEAAGVDLVVEGGTLRRLRESRDPHPLLAELRRRGHPGLVLFSSGTTGAPKAILHDFSAFLARYHTPRPTLRTLSFLLFDHIGGINTLLHTLFNGGTVISTRDRSIANVLEMLAAHAVELLPTTPTFLRMMLLSGMVPERVPDCLRIVTYGTERMDQPTLSALCAALPAVDFRQTYGMSELGIVRVKSEARDSLFMKVGGEGIETRVEDGILKIRSANRMLGYLNAPSPFDAEGWYDTRDRVEVKGDHLRITGRDSDVINVGGLKFMAADVERAALEIPGVRFAKAVARANPITGQHVVLEVEPERELAAAEVKAALKAALPAHMVPSRVRIAKVGYGHRFKRL
ncbi:fatty acid--CoA ligase family protein [Paralimibaculum aggregatum]|uniref:Fatty acid--CoA ligase family protein n=1 Tax=Paralimibaculum aggregatum TaxID=3036245 RepID=A0ABQ6LP17_9RHOB|nr:long-chain fatty acid--CoA ligase [Limibaculum sp. NKW23]GMG82161.1 fatty acid--CoA ligase family protein [Limibaculum sp. NKW23]